jgi:hypothetical protein
MTFTSSLQFSSLYLTSLPFTSLRFWRFPPLALLKWTKYGFEAILVRLLARLFLLFFYSRKEGSGMKRSSVLQYIPGCTSFQLTNGAIKNAMLELTRSRWLGSVLWQRSSGCTWLQTETKILCLTQKGACSFRTRVNRKKNAVFWNAASCKNRCFGGKCRLHLQGRTNSRTKKGVSCFVLFYILSNPLFNII